MAVNYIHDFEQYTFDNKEYKLSFFGYVAGNFGGRLDMDDIFAAVLGDI